MNSGAVSLGFFFTVAAHLAKASLLGGIPPGLPDCLVRYPPHVWEMWRQPPSRVVPETYTLGPVSWERLQGCHGNSYHCWSGWTKIIPTFKDGNLPLLFFSNFLFGCSVLSGSAASSPFSTPPPPPPPFLYLNHPVFFRSGVLVVHCRYVDTVVIDKSFVRARKSAWNFVHNFLEQTVLFLYFKLCCQCMLATRWSNTCDSVFQLLWYIYESMYR